MRMRRGTGNWTVNHSPNHGFKGTTHNKFYLLIFIIVNTTLIHRSWNFCSFYLLSRIGCIVCQQYISLELILQSQQSIDDKPFSLQRHQAYNMCVIRLLQAISKFTSSDFNSNRAWLVPILSQLILCDDRNVRCILSQLYNDFMNGILLL
jgi:hypothetical protein